MLSLFSASTITHLLNTFYYYWQMSRAKKQNKLLSKSRVSVLIIKSYLLSNQICCNDCQVTDRILGLSLYFPPQTEEANQPESSEHIAEEFFNLKTMHRNHFNKPNEVSCLFVCEISFLLKLK